MDPVDSGGETLDVLPIDADRATEPPRPDPQPRRGRRRRSLVAGFAAALVILAALNMAFGGTRADEEAAAPEAPAVADGDAPSTGTAVADPGAIAFGYDGLLEGQYLRHAPAGLPGSVETVTVMCRLTDPAYKALSVLDECDSGTARRGTTSPAGKLEIGFQVFRTITTGRSGTVDCVVDPCELRTFSGRVSGIAASTPLGFGDGPVTADTPRIVVDVANEMRDGGALVVDGVGFPSGTSIHIRPCQMGVRPDPFACAWVLQDTVIETGPDGTFRYEGIADWRIGFGADGIACAQLTDGFCAMNVSIPGAPRQPAAVPLVFTGFGAAGASSQLPEVLTVEPSAGLGDEQTVMVRADGVPYDGELGLFLCIETTPSDCTRVDFFREVDDGEYVLPRSFVTWRGTRHDCAVDGACILSVSTFGESVERVDAPISFDPERPLRAATPATAAPTVDLESGDSVTIDLEESLTLPFVAICAVDNARLCQSIGVAAELGTRVQVEVRSDLTTPVGPHDCLDDGPCELVVWNGAGLERFEPIPLDFRSTPTGALSLTVRPSTGLRHGQPIQIAVGGINDDFPTVSVCVQGTIDCAFATNLVVRDGKAVTEIPATRTIQVYRQFEASLAVVDCAQLVCELRLSDERHILNAPLDFATADPPALPVLAIEARYIDLPLPYDEPVEIRGRGFLPLADGPGISLSVCAADELLQVSCVPVGGVSPRAIQSDGSFAAEIVLPEAAFDDDAIDVLQPCQRNCELVATNGYGEPARLPILRRTP